MAAGALVCILIAGIFTPSTANGQLTGSHAPEKILRGESANLFATWAGGTAIAGFVIHLPPDWKIESASVLRMSFRSLPLRIDSGEGDRHELVLDSPLDAAADIVVRVRSGDGYGSEQVTLTPFAISKSTGRRQLLLADGLSMIVHNEAAYSDPENRVVTFAAQNVRPLVYRSDAMPSMDLNHGFSASFWVKSTGLNEVVLSTWNGDEGEVYPIELVIGPAGRLRCFRGRPGEHQSMGSRKPIADGAWHRITVTNEPEAGWMRLQIDGRTVDSLFSATPLHISMKLPLAIGGRVPADDAYFDGMKPFSGLLDAVRIQKIPARRDNVLNLDFDRGLHEDLLAAPAQGVRLVRSDLSVRRPVDDFRASKLGGAVLLRWHSRASQAGEFAIERSRDGRQFDVVHRVRASPPSGAYEFTDADAGEGVVYYRLRQSFAGGGERVSATIKVGMGGEPTERVTLIGNFPNPFNNTTTISYKVNEQAYVQMSIWDISGQPVRHLVDRTQAPGFYEVQFDADELPSGTYFVRMHTEGGTESHKMILMK